MFLISDIGIGSVLILLTMLLKRILIRDVVFPMFAVAMKSPILTLSSLQGIICDYFYETEENPPSDYHTKS